MSIFFPFSDLLNIWAFETCLTHFITLHLSHHDWIWKSSIQFIFDVLEFNRDLIVVGDRLTGFGTAIKCAALCSTHLTFFLKILIIAFCNLGVMLKWLFFFFFGFLFKPLLSLIYVLLIWIIGFPINMLDVHVSPLFDFHLLFMHLFNVCLSHCLLHFCIFFN